MEQSNPTNLFNVYLNAADCLGGIATRSDIARFDIGSILSQAPNAEELENAGSCLIKVKYFSKHVLIRDRYYFLYLDYCSGN